MNIVFRADSSVEIGSGHVMRCLALAEYFRDHGAQVAFLCREFEGNICSLIESKGFHVHRLQGEGLGKLSNAKFSQAIDGAQHEDVMKGDIQESSFALVKHGSKVDWLIVDHYALDHRWESALRLHAERIMAIDDIANRKHDCNLLLDQNLYEHAERRYDELVSGTCRKLLGPKYALLRPEFIAARSRLRERDGRIRRILVFFGGSDPTDETSKALDAIRMVGRPEIIIDVVVGQNNPRGDSIKEMCREMVNVSYHCQIDNMAEMMSRADISLGAGGSATWERCALALPALIISTAENQVAIAEAVDHVGAQTYLGNSNAVNKVLLAGALTVAIGNPQKIRCQEVSAGQITDACGVARVADIIGIRS